MKKAIGNDNIIDTEHIQDIIEMKIREKLLKQHPYSIWEGEKDKKWYTYLPDETKSRKKALKKRNSKEEIEDLVVEYWKQIIKIESEKSKKYVFQDAYNNWRSVQDQLVKENSVAKYETDFKRFFEGTDFLSMKIEDITEDKIRIFMVQTIERLKLPKETSRKLFGYISNSIFYARKNLGLESNPLEFLKAKDFYKYCHEKFVPPETKVVSKDKMKLLQEQFYRDHQKMPNYIPTYAVEFACLTGMRVGEIAALRWECITQEYILIDKSEKSDRTKKRYWIEGTKNNKERLFPMTEEIRKLLFKIKKVETEYGYLCEWVFANEDGRIHAPLISACIKTKCRQLGIEVKGIHAFRKTLNSNMRCKGVSSTVASTILGHSPQVNERYYTFDVMDMDEKAKLLEEINLQTVVV